MSISSEIARLQGNISDSLTAVANKGVTVPSGSNSDDLAGLIAQISGGGSGEVEIEVVSSNLHDTSEDVPNVYINGSSESAYNGWSATGYIPVKPDTYYQVVHASGKQYNAFYKSDKTAAKSSVIVPNSSSDSKTLIKTTSNTYYIRMSGTTSEVANYEIYEVNVVDAGGGTPSLQAKTNISPTTSSQTITPDSGYDGLSSVQINAMPSGTAGTPSASKGTVNNHSVSVTPTVTNTTGYITGGTKTGTAVTVSASELVSGNKEITANGTGIDVANYSTVSVAVPSSGSSKNVQVAQSTTRATSSTYTSLVSLTCSKTGKYDIYWDCFRSSTGGTSGSQLYVGGSAYGTANTAFTNHIQTNHLSNVSLTQNQTVAVYARSRGSNYYAYVGQLTIIEA